MSARVRGMRGRAVQDKNHSDLPPNTTLKLTSLLHSRTVRRHPSSLCSMRRFLRAGLHSKLVRTHNHNDRKTYPDYLAFSPLQLIQEFPQNSPTLTVWSTKDIQTLFLCHRQSTLHLPSPNIKHSFSSLQARSCELHSPFIVKGGPNASP